jgi:hypothetical protein
MTDNLVLSFQRSVPVRHEADVFVAGAGLRAWPQR